MTRRDEQSQRWKLLAQPKKNSGEDFFFATMGAATKEDQAWRGFGGRLPQRRGYRDATGLNRRDEFDASGYMDSGLRNSEGCPSVHGPQFWKAPQIEQHEHSRD